jgi:hypothetical protein
VNIADMTRSALATLRGDLENPTFTWKGAEIPCVPNSLGVGSIVEAGGFEMTVTLSLHVDRREFFSADSTLWFADSDLMTMDNDRPTPVSGKTLVYKGATYRIIRTTKTADGASIGLICGDRNA